MENRPKRDKHFYAIVSTFENMYASGQSPYMDESTLSKLITYYEDELMYHKAIDVINIALNQYSFRSDLYILKSRILYKLGNYEKALNNVQKAEQIAPYELEIQILKARILASSGRQEEALSLVEDLKEITSNADKVEVYICESHIHESLQNFNHMYQCLCQAIEIAPTCIEALERIWLAVELSKQYYDSIRLHKSLIDQNPYSHLAWFNLGHAYSCIGEYELAIDAIEYSFIINEQFAVGYIDCADLCFDTQNYAKAKDIYNEYIKHFGAEEELLHKLAETLLNLGEIGDALNAINQAIHLDQYNDEYYHILAKCHIANDSYNLAIKAFHKAIAIEDFVEDYYLGLGKAYETTGAYNKAEQFLRKAALMAPEDGKYWAEYVVFLLKIRDLDKAFIVLNESKNTTYSASLMYCEFAALHFAGKREEAVEALQEALLDDIDEHSIIYEIEPEFRLNKDITAMINYYMSEIISR